MNKKLNEQGIGLVETLIALTVAIIVITSLVSLSVYTLRASNRGKLYLQGSKQANEGLELVRAYRDKQEWSTFISAMTNCDSGAQCHVTVTGSTLNVVPGLFRNTQGTSSVADDVTWYFTVRHPTSGAIITTSDTVVRIEVRASWNIGNDPQNAYVYSDLSNWRNL